MCWTVEFDVCAGNNSWNMLNQSKKNCHFVLAFGNQNAKKDVHKLKDKTKCHTKLVKIQKKKEWGCGGYSHCVCVWVFCLCLCACVGV